MKGSKVGEIEIIVEDQGGLDVTVSKKVGRWSWRRWARWDVLGGSLFR